MIAALYACMVPFGVLRPLRVLSRNCDGVQPKPRRNAYEKVAVAGEAEVEGESGEVVGVRQLDERVREAQLRQVLVQRDSFDARRDP